MIKLRDNKGRFVKGHIVPKRWIENLIKCNTGIKFTEERKEKISKGNKGKTRTIEQRLKYGLAKKGEKCHFFKDGKYDRTLGEKVRNLKEYKNWRTSVFKRDDYTCQKCDERGLYLEAHHIIPFKFITEEYELSFNDITNKFLILNASKYEKLWDINNGITYCKECHIEEDTFRGGKIGN